MKSTNKPKSTQYKKIDPIPESFASEEQAGEFWDTHSTADYEEYLEPVDMTINIQKRQYFIEVDEDSFLSLFQYSKTTNAPIKRIASKILKETIGTAHS
jgi:hypothetical protein